MSPALNVAIAFKLVDEISKGLANIQHKIGHTVNKIEALSRIQKGAMAVYTGLGAVLIGAGKSFADFESSLTPLKTVVTSTMGSVNDSMRAFSEAALKYSSTHKQTAQEFLQASYMMSSAGLNDVQAIAGTNVALDVATATMGDAVEAANLLGMAYNNFADRTKDPQVEMTRLGDVLAKTQQKFQIPALGQLTEGLKYASSAALAVGGATLLALKSAANSAANFESSLHKQSAEEFLQASYQMSSSGLNDIQAIEGTRKALALATATMGDSTEAANLLALSYNNFADQNADVAKEMSRLFKSHNWKLKRVSLKSKV